MSSGLPPLLNARQHALFLDFDGTLAPLQDDPDAVYLRTADLSRLVTLADWLGGALAAISGRDVRDLSARVPVAIWRAGGHGLEICGPGETPAPAVPPAPGGLLSAIEAAARRFPGTRTEPKGRVVAVHYRAVPHVEAALLEAVEQALASAGDAAGGYAIQRGKMVLEAKPASAHKGRALEHMMAAPPFADRLPVMVGDDTTDEDAMASALRAGGLAVKVGAGDTVAPYRLADPRAVWDWLASAQPSL